MKFFFIKQIVVGTLIFMGLTIFIFFTVVIGNSDGTFLKSSHIYKSIHKEIRGLNIGSEVTIHGTRTGNIIKINLLKNGTIEVAFTIKTDHLFMINQSSTTQLKTQGALGDRYINIATKDLSAPSLGKGDYLKTKPSLDLLSIISGGNKNKKSIESLLQEMDIFMRKVNKNDIASVLSNANKNEISSILRSLGSILRKIDNGQGSAGSLINNKKLYNRLLVLLGVQPRSYLKDLSNKSKNEK